MPTTQKVLQWRKNKVTIIQTPIARKMRPKKGDNLFLDKTNDGPSAHFGKPDAKARRLFAGWHGDPSDAANQEWESIKPEGTEGW